MGGKAPYLRLKYRAGRGGGGIGRGSCCSSGSSSDVGCSTVVAYSHFPLCTLHPLPHHAVAAPPSSPLPLLHTYTANWGTENRPTLALEQQRTVCMAATGVGWGPCSVPDWNEDVACWHRARIGGEEGSTGAAGVEGDPRHGEGQGTSCLTSPPAPMQQWRGGGGG